MTQLEAKILEINSKIKSYGINCDLKGLSEPVKVGSEETKREIGSEIVIDFNTDSDLSGYHIQTGETSFDKFQNRGKGKMYFPVVPLALVCLCKDINTESSVINAIKGIKGITIKNSDPDKYKIWKDETGKDNPNIDYHFFKVGYDFSFTTTDCDPFCK